MPNLVRLCHVGVRVKKPQSPITVLNFLNQSKPQLVTTVLNHFIIFSSFSCQASFFPCQVSYLQGFVISFASGSLWFILGSNSKFSKFSSCSVIGHVRFMSFSVYINFNFFFFFFCKFVWFSHFLVCCCRCIWFLILFSS